MSTFFVDMSTSFSWGPKVSARVGQIPKSESLTPNINEDTVITRYKQKGTFWQKKTQDSTQMGGSL